MKRNTIFDLLAILMGVVIGSLAMEVAVRAFADDGKQFDFEMWKYALEVKGISPDLLIGHNHRPNRHAVLMGVQVRHPIRRVYATVSFYMRSPPASCAS